MNKEFLFGKTLNELKDVVKKHNLPQFSSTQISDWLYKKDINSISEMSNLSKKSREILDTHYSLGLADHLKVEKSTDGTKKYLFPANENNFVEAAYIPDHDRGTLCISTQIGCKMGCVFCMTARQGYNGNLTCKEILNQIQSLPEKQTLTNIVYMGMGEPLDNLDEVLKSLDILTSPWGYAWSPTRITVSTIGLINSLKILLEKSNCHIAISLHSPFDDERKQLMPIQRTQPIHEVLKILKIYNLKHQRRISFEYIMFKDVNDTPKHLQELLHILKGIDCRVNLLRFHPIPDSKLSPSDEKILNDFKNTLTTKGIITTIRKSRGLDIGAACGMLSTKELQANHKK